MVIKNKIKASQLKKFYPLMNLLPDQTMIKLQHWAALGRIPNLKKPERFSDKIQWYKLNYKNPLMTVCADKYQIREYIKQKGFENNLNDLYGVFDNYDQVQFSNLPPSFVIKSNNGSGTNIFIKDNEKVDLNLVKETINDWNKVDTLTIGREWAYKEIPQKLIVEELLEPEDLFQKKFGLNDYKFMCFNGVPRLVWVDVNRNNNHSRNFYTLEWELLDVKSDKPNFTENIEKPEGYEKMLEISRELSKDFPFVRVDFYSVNNKVYIGEMTFYPWSGIVKFMPDDFDFYLGELFTLPLSETNSGSDYKNA